MSRNTKIQLAEKPAEKRAGGSTERAGYTFVSNMMQPFSTDGIIKARDIYAMTENLYVAGPIRQLMNMIISGELSISVYDEEDNVVEDVSRGLNSMFSRPECNLNAAARAALSDMWYYGCSIFNPVWKRQNRELVCTELAHLMPYTFAENPQNLPDARVVVSGRLLKGIYYNLNESKMHYVQKQGQVYVDIPEENLFVVKDPSSQNPDGDSLVLNMGSVIKFINYAWNAFGQQMFRVGAPIMFIRISNPKPASWVGGEYIDDDVTFADNVLKTWGKDTGFKVRENMDVHIVDVKEGSLSKTAIESATEAIVNYLSPAGMLGKDGTLISGNSDASLRIVNNYIQGWITVLSSALRELPNYYLKHNAYPEGWHAEINIPSVTLEDSERKLSYAQLLSSTHAGTVNEVRELLGLEGISPDEMDEMQAEWAKLQSAQQPEQMSFSDTVPRNYRRRRSEIVGNAAEELYAYTDDLLRESVALMRREAKRDRGNPN